MTGPAEPHAHSAAAVGNRLRSAPRQEQRATTLAAGRLQAAWPARSAVLQARSWATARGSRGGSSAPMADDRKQEDQLPSLSLGLGTPGPLTTYLDGSILSEAGALGLGDGGTRSLAIGGQSSASSSNGSGLSPGLRGFDLGLGGPGGVSGWEPDHTMLSQGLFGSFKLLK